MSIERQQCVLRSPVLEVDLLKAAEVRQATEVGVAIQNASSVAALLITTEAMVAEVPKKNTGSGGMPQGGGMGGMDF